MNAIVPILLFLLFGIFVRDVFRLPSNLKSFFESGVCYGVMIVLVVLAAMRDENVGTDTYDYIVDYEEMSLMSFSDIWQEYEGYIGYYYLSKLFSMAKAPLWLWFGFLEAIYLLAVARWVFSYSRDRIYSLLLFIVLGHYLFSLAALKQVLATALSLLAFMDFSKKRYLPFLLWSLCSFFVHPVLLIMLLAVFLYVLRKSGVYYPILALIVSVIAFGALTTLSLFVLLLGNDHFDMYLIMDSSYSAKTLILFLLLMVCAFPFYPAYSRKSPLARFELGCICVACAFQYVASTSSPDIFRLASVFSIFFLTFLPNVFHARKTFLSMSLKYVALLGALIFFIYSNRHFVFSFSA